MSSLNLLKGTWWELQLFYTFFLSTIPTIIFSWFQYFLFPKSLNCLRRNILLITMKWLSSSKANLRKSDGKKHSNSFREPADPILKIRTKSGCLKGKSHKQTVPKAFAWCCTSLAEFGFRKTHSLQDTCQKTNTVGELKKSKRENNFSRKYYSSKTDYL